MAHTSVYVWGMLISLFAVLSAVRINRHGKIQTLTRKKPTRGAPSCLNNPGSYANGILSSLAAVMRKQTSKPGPPPRLLHNQASSVTGPLPKSLIA